MRREEKYILGTAREIAEYIIDESFKFKHPAFIKGELKPYDFAVAEISDGQSLEEIALSSSGWYGIKQIETGFDFEGINLFADYYGGRCGICDEIDVDFSRDECCKIVRKMILDVLNTQEVCHSDTLIIAEPAWEGVL